MGAALLALVLAIAVMVRLGIWQWHRGRERGSLLNYGYAIEWFTFAVIAVAGPIRLHWERIDTSEKRQPERSPNKPLIGPPLEPGQALEEVTWVRIRRRIGLDRAPSDTRVNAPAEFDRDTVKPPAGGPGS
jgi:hypothetical protein